MKKYFWLILLVITCVPSVAYAHEEVTYERKNRLDNYQTITISQSGSLFYSVTNEIIESVKNLDTNLSFIGRANVGLEKIVDQAGNQKLNTKTDYLYSVSIKTVEKDFANFIYPTELADKINNNLIIVSELTANLYAIEIGDVIHLVGTNGDPIELVVGDIVPDSKLGWFEAVVNKEIGFKLGIYRNIQAIIWDNKITENHLIEIYRNIKYKKIRVSDESSKLNKNWVLPNALVKEMFGDFQLKEKDGTWIITEPKWREENIQTIRMPIIGRTTCHRLMWEPLRGALNQIDEEGLADTLFTEEFRTSGGCYAPRRISRFDAGGSISRHAWGIAIDINTKSGYVPRVVEIFNSWGFAWGGTWTSPDEMHFELRDLSASISKTSG
ncbi:M15 family metallopeptidase [Candidatus Actinomarina]|nr:M15 family metallopeptidase [Candidatus Actinomarina sp.]